MIGKSGNPAQIDDLTGDVVARLAHEEVANVRAILVSTEALDGEVVDDGVDFVLRHALDHVGHDRGRAERIAGDAPLPELEGQDAREGDDRALGGRVHGLTSEGNRRHDRGEVDDAAILATHHHLGGVTTDEHRAGDVHFQHTIGRLGGREQHVVHAGNRRVVEHRVDATVTLGDIRHHVTYALLVGDVDLVVTVERVVDVSLAATTTFDGVALLQVVLDQVAADALASTGDEHDRMLAAHDAASC